MLGMGGVVGSKPGSNILDPAYFSGCDHMWTSRNLNYLHVRTTGNSMDAAAKAHFGVAAKALRTTGHTEMVEVQLSHQDLIARPSLAQHGYGSAMKTRPSIHICAFWMKSYQRLYANMVLYSILVVLIHPHILFGQQPLVIKHGKSGKSFIYRIVPSKIHQFFNLPSRKPSFFAGFPPKIPTFSPASPAKPSPSSCAAPWRTPTHFPRVFRPEVSWPRSVGSLRGADHGA